MKTLISAMLLSLAVYHSNAQKCISLNLNDSLEVSPFDLAVQGDLLLIGETHGYKENFEWQLYWIKHLYYQQNVRQILLEIPVAFNFFLGNYFKSGNIDPLKKAVFNKREASVYSSNEFLDFISKFRKWNNSLPEGEKVQLVPFDSETDPSNTLLALRKLIPDGKLPDEIRETVNMMVRYRNEGIYTQQKMQMLSNQLESSFLSFKPVYQEVLGENFQLFSGIAFSFINSCYNLREVVMYLNVINWFSVNEHKGNTFGQLGALHCLTGKYDVPGYYLGQMLNEEKSSIFKKHVQSVLMLYDGEENEDGNPVSPVPEYIQSMAERECKDSPFIFETTFKKAPYTDQSKGFQYFMVVDDASPLSPLK